MEMFFFICLVAGVGWALIVGVLGPLLGGVFEHAGTLGGEDAHADLSHDHSSGELLLTPLSPQVIASFLATFGGMGLIAIKALGLGKLSSFLIASPSALIVAAIFFYVVKFLGGLTQASSEARVQDVIGSEAEITVPIPAGGLGEIAYYSLGSRYTAPARCEEGALDRTGKVYIDRIEGGVYYVKKFSNI